MTHDASTPGEGAAFAERVRRRLPPGVARTHVASPSDYDLNPDMPPGQHRGLLAATAPPAALRPAAVLIGVVARAELTVLLTRRTDTLRRHAGQIAFPGGRIDTTDASSAAAALREAHEEVGLDPAFVEPLGFLDTYRTATGYAIEPLIALVEPAFTLTLQATEVAEAFEVPLAFLMDPVNHQTHTKLWNGASRRFYAIAYESRYIWGATAGILQNMHERLFAP